MYRIYYFWMVEGTWWPAISRDFSNSNLQLKKRDDLENDHLDGATEFKPLESTFIVKF